MKEHNNDAEKESDSPVILHDPNDSPHFGSASTLHWEALSSPLDEENNSFS